MKKTRVGPEDVQHDEKESGESMFRTDSNTASASPSLDEDARKKHEEAQGRTDENATKEHFERADQVRSAFPGVPDGQMPSSSPPGAITADKMTPGSARKHTESTPAQLDDRALVEEEVQLPNGGSMKRMMRKVNLRDVVIINGERFGPGEGVLVPDDAFDVWKNALA